MKKSIFQSLRLGRIQFAAISLTAAIAVISCVNSAEAAPCDSNYWQPTFVHDLELPDGPWYVTPGGGFIKLCGTDGSTWVPHACELINTSGVRDIRGFTTCQDYTRIQCGCSRNIPGNTTCAGFLAGHSALMAPTPCTGTGTGSGTAATGPAPGTGSVTAPAPPSKSRQWGVWAYRMNPNTGWDDPCNIQYVIAVSPNKKYDNNLRYRRVRTAANRREADKLQRIFSQFYDDQPDFVVKMQPCKSSTRVTVKPPEDAGAGGGHSSTQPGYDPRKDPNIPKDKTQVDIAQVDKLGEDFQRDTGKKPDKDTDKTKAPLTPTAPQQTDASNTTGTKPDETTQPPYPPYPPYGPPPTDRTGPTKDWTGWATGPKPQSGSQPSTHSTGQSTTQTTTQTTGQSTTQPTTKPPATGGSTPAPVDTRTVACSTTTKSGGNTPSTITVKVGHTKGTAKFSYTMYTAKDRMIVQYGGQTLLNTGCVSGSKTVSLNLSGASDSVIVTVQPECEKKELTNWNFTLECPQPASR